MFVGGLGEATTTQLGVATGERTGRLKGGMNRMTAVIEEQARRLGNLLKEVGPGHMRRRAAWGQEGRAMRTGGACCTRLA